VDEETTPVGDPPRTPLEWMARLEKQLNADQRELQIYDDYYEGRHPLAFATPKFRDAFGLAFREFADNWCQLVVDATEERLNVEGFRLGSNTEGDKRAWKIWQTNQLDAGSQLAHNEALISKRCYALVWDGDRPDVPSITIEHPTEMTLATAAGNTRRRLAGMKRWLDDSGYIFGTLYLPDGLYKFRSKAKAQSNRIATTMTTKWERRESPTEVWPLPNRLRVVPVVPFYNRPRLLSPGVSEIRNVIPIQNGVNKLVLDMIVASEFGAAPQRWATGLEVPKDPITGQPVELFKTMLDRIWSVKNPNTKFGEFSSTDLTNFVKGIELLVQHVASQTRTPPHYFYLSGQFPSGESIKSAETGLVAKTRRKMRHFGESWEEVMRLAFLVIGDDRRARQAESCETIWADPESRSEAEHIDALLKQKAFGVPDEILWEKAGYSPQEIERMKAIKAAERLQAPAPLVVPPAQPTVADVVPA
jgi:hypothetical protein